MWNNKFKSKNKPSTSIDGVTDEAEIAYMFAKGFLRANKLYDKAK